MQFMDNVVGKWSTIGSVVNGILRLRNIHDAILEQNREEINDPVEVINKGTCFDGNKNIKRQNYAFYEGYSRINWEVEKPDYSGKRSGTGVMFRVSENIELYGAKLGIESAAFDTAPFLTGKQGTRIILKSDDSLLSKITGDSSGCWLKGIPETGKERFEIGITPVRLTIKELTIDPVKTAIPFSLTNEEKRRGDIEGEIIDDGERSILKVYALSNNGTKTDTLKNISEPGILLHRQKRVLEYNKDFMMGDKLDFQVVTKPEDNGKVFVDKSQISGYRAVLVDTSVTSGGWTGLVYEFLGSQLIRCVGVEGETRRLGMVDAEDGVCEVWCDGIVGIAMETDDKKWLLEKDRKKVEIKLRSKGNVVIYSARNKSKQLFPIPPGLIKFKKDGDAYVIKWQDYEGHFLKNDSIYATVDKGEYGEFEIVAQYKSTNQEHTKEKAIILGVPKIRSIEFTSDYVDKYGNNIIRKAPTFVENGIQCRIGPEWKNGSEISFPILHKRSSLTNINIAIDFSVPGKYEIKGTSTVNGLSYNKIVDVGFEGWSKISLISINELNEEIGTENAVINWEIFRINPDGYKFLVTSDISNHTIFTIFDKPVERNSLGLPNLVTDIRLKKCMQFIRTSNDDINDIILDLKLGIESELSYANERSRDLIKVNEVWKLFDQDPSDPKSLGAQCNELAVLFESVLRMYGLNAKYYQVLPSTIASKIRLWSPDNIIPVGWYLDNSDSTKHHPEDEWQDLEGVNVKVDVLSERLLFWMGYWNEGEGSVYCNNIMYPMLYKDLVYGIGNTPKKAAINMLIEIDTKLTSRPSHLQTWAVLFKYTKTYLGPCKKPDNWEEIPIDE
jgi:hypothetical protein